jgi:hypothetical protein
MQLVEVNDALAEKEFINIGAVINRQFPNYIRPLDNEVKDVFDPKKNKIFKYGEAIRWILKENGNSIGRIAAFYSKKYKAKGTDYPVGNIGFFDCINHQEAANALFDAAKSWLQSKGMDAMDGPVNFGDRDKWWGLMVEGFEKKPIYGMAFNPPYYEQLFENYGFKNFYNQYYFSMPVNQTLSARFQERHTMLKMKVDYTAKHIDVNNLEKHAAEFAAVYNAAWAQHGENKEITKAQVLKLFKKMKPILDPRIVWFAYFKDEPIAMWINIPDLNEYFKHFNGKFGLWQKLQMYWMMKTGQCKRFTGVAFGVVPKYQSQGVDSFMIYEGALLIQGKHLYIDYEMGWSGDWNPKMMNVYDKL